MPVPVTSRTLLYASILLVRHVRNLLDIPRDRSRLVKIIPPVRKCRIHKKPNPCEKYQNQYRIAKARTAFFPTGRRPVPPSFPGILFIQLLWRCILIHDYAAERTLHRPEESVHIDFNIAIDVFQILLGDDECSASFTLSFRDCDLCRHIYDGGHLSVLVNVSAFLPFGLAVHIRAPLQSRFRHFRRSRLLKQRTLRRRCLP